MLSSDSWLLQRLSKVGTLRWGCYLKSMSKLILLWLSGLAPSMSAWVPSFYQALPMVTSLCQMVHRFLKVGPMLQVRVQDRSQIITSWITGLWHDQLKMGHFQMKPDGIFSPDPFHKQLVLTIKFARHNQEQHNCDHPACVEKKGSY